MSRERPLPEEDRDDFKREGKVSAHLENGRGSIASRVAVRVGGSGGWLVVGDGSRGGGRHLLNVVGREPTSATLGLKEALFSEKVMIGNLRKVDKV